MYFKLDTREFNRAAAAYVGATKKELADVMNKKAAWIVRRALWYTPKADYQKMANELGQELQTITRTSKKTGKTKTTLTALANPKSRKDRSWLRQKNTARTANAPLLALIINARRGRKGLPGLHGAAMLAEFKRVLGARARSIGYLKSGWLPALNIFRRFQGGGRGLPPVDRSVKGQNNGGGVVATAMRPRATIWNEASKNRNHKNALIRFGKPALERAFTEETADMRSYIARKMRDSARRIGIRTR